MGNCLFGGLGDGDGVIKVTTSNGGIMEFYTPISAGSISKEFPDHAIYPAHNLFWKPLSVHEELVLGQSYYLLPINKKKGTEICSQLVREGHVRSKSIPNTSLVESAPYRMSFDCHGALRRSYTEVFSRYQKTGFWKVKLVISPEQLVEILSQEGKTEELIGSVRAVAKCGNKSGISYSSASSVGFSDHWSLSTSRNASSKKDELIMDII